ncbi:MAG: DUF2075 domain-containing protein [Oxalobacteraceae bacterium]|nr:DUF2075 domain-containing protein [Oxalobacteraceae bacterium]
MTLKGWIYFEFSIPRMGKRADVVLLIGGIVFVIEFKVGSHSFDSYAIEQAHDYALDLKNFHLGSHNAPIVPILIPTSAPPQAIPAIKWAADQVAEPLCISPEELPQALEVAVTQCAALPIDAIYWSQSGYRPTPTIVEAALALYRQHDVKEIKTLAGLNIATSRAAQHSDEHAVFLSGNGPLVDVLREALARDKAEREGIPRSHAYREVSTFVQNIHHFRDDALENTNPPIEKVVVFDEAQRAWNRDMASKFMQQKRGISTFDMSEPAFLLDAMNRHKDWCVVICLVGGGQEINTGEAGLSEWISVVRDQHPDWDIHVSSRLDDRDYIWDAELAKELIKTSISWDEALHLSVSIRSFRAEALSNFVGHVVDNKPDQARSTFLEIADKYPIRLTRDLGEARSWLKSKARGSERYGLIASSGANRLRPDGIWIKSKVDAPVWFLNDKMDVRSSYYLEEAASEFDIQGLELDWVCVGWDADFRRVNGEWEHFSFRGTKWQRVNAADRQLYLKNAYRVLLTRARQGMVIFVPPGDPTDPTRSTQIYDRIYEYLKLCGIPCDQEI